MTTLEHDIGTHGGTYNDGVEPIDRLAMVKEILTSWYIDEPNGEPFRVEPGSVGAVMRTWRRGAAHGLTDVEEVIARVLLGVWARVYQHGERKAMEARAGG